MSSSSSDSRTILDYTDVPVIRCPTVFLLPTHTKWVSSAQDIAALREHEGRKARKVRQGQLSRLAFLFSKVPQSL